MNVSILDATVAPAIGVEHAAVCGKPARPALAGAAGARDHDRMSQRERFTADQAREVGEQIGIDWAAAPFDVEQFRAGMDVELEHGRHDPQTDVTGSDPVVTGKIALAHLKEFPDYYTRLAAMESEAEDYWRDRA
jgi:hypothetical protein